MVSLIGICLLCSSCQRTTAKRRSCARIAQCTCMHAMGRTSKRACPASAAIWPMHQSLLTSLLPDQPLKYTGEPSSHLARPFSSPASRRIIGESEPVGL